jgi:hypothetical protein
MVGSPPLRGAPVRVDWNSEQSGPDAIGVGELTEPFASGH